MDSPFIDNNGEGGREGGGRRGGADLAEIQLFSTFNKRIHFLLCVIELMPLVNMLG